MYKVKTERTESGPSLTLGTKRVLKNLNKNKRILKSESKKAKWKVNNLFADVFLYLYLVVLES